MQRIYILDQDPLTKVFYLYRKFAFCQYPFLISMGAKMQIMEMDAKQQMEIKRREAFFNMLFHQRASPPYLVLSIRRHYLIEDSLRQVPGCYRNEKKKKLTSFL